MRGAKAETPRAGATTRTEAAASSVLRLTRMPSAAALRVWVSQTVTAMEGFADQVLISMVCRRVVVNSNDDICGGFDARLLEADLRVLMDGRATEFVAALSAFMAPEGDLGLTLNPYNERTVGAGEGRGARGDLWLRTAALPLSFKLCASMCGTSNSAVCANVWQFDSFAATPPPPKAKLSGDTSAEHARQLHE